MNMEAGTRHSGNSKPVDTADTPAPVLSVVIACYNQSRELDLTLRSFLNQDFPHEKYEILVVDDHSPDLSARGVVAAHRRRCPKAVIDYIRHYRTDGGTYGFSARVKNIGIRYARGTYIFFNNSEILQAGQSLEYIVNQMENSPVPLCLRGRVIDLPYQELDGLSQEALEQLHDHTDRKRERTATADHAGLAAVPRAVLNQVGGIDERFDYWGKEDLDLAARLKRVGVKYVYDECMKSFHIYHPPNHAKRGHYLRMCELLEENNRLGATEVNVGRPWGNLNPPPESQLAGTVIVETRGNLERLREHLETLIYHPVSPNPGPQCTAENDVMVVCEPLVRPQVESFLAQHYRTVPLLVIPGVDAGPGGGVCEDTGYYILNKVRTPRVAFFNEAAEPHAPDWKTPDHAPEGIVTLVGQVTYPDKNVQVHESQPGGWMCLTPTALKLLGPTASPRQWEPARLIQETGHPGLCRPASPLTAGAPAPGTSPAPAIKFSSRVMAVIPHYKCEQWLPQCLESLLTQTRPPDAVVVVDDGSPTPPEDIVKRFPGVTLMAAAENVGPYRLVQQVIDSFDADVYMFQDADDWSAADRLELLLKEAERTGAEMVGCQEMQVPAPPEGPCGLRPVCYPLDVNLALTGTQRQALMHGGSIITRSLVRRAGGFATGLRFGGDTEFIYRVMNLARIVNIPDFCYFRRVREDSLTAHPTTGLGSPAREELKTLLKKRAHQNESRHTKGLPPLLEPLKQHPPVEWTHICGPNPGYW